MPLPASTLFRCFGEQEVSKWLRLILDLNAGKPLRPRHLSAITAFVLLFNCGRFMWPLQAMTRLLRGRHRQVGLAQVANASLSAAMMRFLIAAVAVLVLGNPVLAQSSARVDAALDAAIKTFETALPFLADSESGVDIAAYRDALTLQRFGSTHWGGQISLDIERRDEATGSCSRFAAFVLLPPRDGSIDLVLCPQFFSDGADALRELTILHEMVHVVAGPDECRAMAFAARIELLAKGAFTPVDGYWQAQDCSRSAFRLP